MSAIRRLPDWSPRLASWLASVSGAEYSPGTYDCCLFTSGAVFAMTGTDLSLGWVGRYTTVAGGLRILRRAGYRDHVELARSHLPPLPRGCRPVPGDLAVLPYDNTPTLGVFQGAAVYAPSSVGWCLVPVSDANEFIQVPF